MAGTAFSAVEWSLEMSERVLSDIERARLNFDAPVLHSAENHSGPWQLQPKDAQIRVHNGLPTRH